MWQWQWIGAALGVHMVDIMQHMWLSEVHARANLQACACCLFALGFGAGRVLVKCHAEVARRNMLHVSLVGAAWHRQTWFRL